MLNSVILIGRLVATPTLKVYDNDLTVTSIILAVIDRLKIMRGNLIRILSNVFFGI